MSVDVGVPVVCCAGEGGHHQFVGPAEVMPGVGLPRYPNMSPPGQIAAGVGLPAML
jgi:hypothetical protein